MNGPDVRFVAPFMGLVTSPIIYDWAIVGRLWVEAVSVSFIWSIFQNFNDSIFFMMLFLILNIFSYKWNPFFT